MKSGSQDATGSQYRTFDGQHKEFRALDESKGPQDRRTLRVKHTRPAAAGSKVSGSKGGPVAVGLKAVVAHGRQAAGRELPKKLRPTLAELQYMNDAIRTLEMQEQKAQKAADGDGVLRKPFNLRSHTEVEEEVGAYRGGSVRIVDQRTPQRALEIRQKFLPQLGRITKHPAESQEQPLKDTPSVNIVIDSGAALTADDAGRQRDSFHANATPLSMSLKTARAEQSAARKSWRSRQRIAGSGSPAHQGVMALERHAVGQDPGLLLHGQGPGACRLMNFTLMEKLSRTYKDTGKYDINTIREEMAREKASNNALSAKHKLQGIAAQRMQSQGTPSVAPSLQGSPASPNKLTHDLLSSSVSAFKKKRLKPIDEAGNRKTLYPRIYFNKNLSLKDSVGSQPNRDELAVTAENRSQETHDRTGTEWGQPISPQRASRLQPPPSLSTVKHNTTMQNDPEWHRKSQMMQAQDADVVRLKKFGMQGGNQAQKQTGMLRSQLTKAKNSMSMTRQAKAYYQELARNKDRHSLMAKGSIGTRSRSTLESMGQVQMQLQYPALGSKGRPNDIVTMTRHVSVHDSKATEAAHVQGDSKGLLSPKAGASNQEFRPADQAAGPDDGKVQQAAAHPTIDMNIQAQSFAVASLRSTPMDQAPLPAQVSYTQAVPVLQNDYNAFLTKNQDSIRALQTCPAQRTRNDGLAGNPLSTEEGVAYEACPNRHGSEDELDPTHQRDTSLSNNNINAWPLAHERNHAMVLNHSSLYVSPRRPLSDCNSGSGEIDLDPLEAQQPAADYRQQLLGNVISSSLRTIEPGALSKSLVTHDPMLRESSKFEEQEGLHTLAQTSEEFQLKQASDHSAMLMGARAPFLHPPITLHDQTHSHLDDLHSSSHRRVLSNKSIATQMVENQENLPRLQRLAQIDYAMARIGSQFKMEVLNRYGLAQSGYGALFRSRQSLNSEQSLGGEEDQALSPMNIMFGRDAEGFRNIKYNIQSHADSLNGSIARADLRELPSRVLDSARSDDSSRKTRKLMEGTTQGAITEASRRSMSNHLNIVEPKNAIESQEKLSKLNEVPQKAAAPRKYDPSEQIDVTDSDRKYLPQDMINMIEKDKEQNLSNDRKQKVWEACHFIDSMVKGREAQAKAKWRMFKDPDLFKNRDEEMAQILGESTLPSSLERCRLRKLKEYTEQIYNKQNEIIRIQQTETAELHSATKAREVFWDLIDKDLDPEVKQTIHKVDPETAAFLGKIIREAHNASERQQIAKKLQEDLRKMIVQQMQFDMQIKHQIAVKKRKQQERVLKSIMEKIRGRSSMKLTPTIKKLQEVVNATARLEKPQSKIKPGADLGKLLFGDQPRHRKRPKAKSKNRFQKLVKKHFFSGGKAKLDLVFVTKLARLAELFEQIFGCGNLGEAYERLKTNVWANQYLREVRGKLLDINVDFDIDFERSQLGLANVAVLFSDDVGKLQFYRQAKQFVHLDETETDKEKIANQHYFRTCIQNQEPPLPAFARLHRHCLFLTECRVSEAMSLALREYLDATKSNPQKITKCLLIDDCGMKDSQFAQILQGLESQGSKIKQIVYSNNDMSYKSMEVFLRLIPHLREVHFNNITRSYGKPMFHQIVEHCLDYGVQLQRLKLSNINLNDNQIVQNLCLLLQQRPFLTSLDISWARLSSKQLNQIIKALAEKYEHTLRNLNISYNSLMQPPRDENAYFDDNDPNYVAAEDFVENLCEFMQKNDLLYHLDLSGMNLADEQILQISQTATTCEGLIALHMSDNGIRAEKELLDEVLDLFGLSDDIFKDREYRVNNPVSNPQGLREIIKKYTLTLNRDQILNQSDAIDAKAYKKHLLQQKQGKVVSNKRIINQAQTSAGIGRTESTLVDNFVLQRQLNQPELIFNQCRYKDCYFEEDSSENWHLQDGACGMGGGCPVCRRHKYTLIFYQQEESPIAISENEGLIEIKDEAVVEQIKEELNLLGSEEQEPTPIICGTVVNGSFHRKLRMLRADLFCMLTVCHSAHFVTEFKQIKKIKAGILANVLKSQDLNGKDESIEYLKGWHRRLLVDKCLNNEATDMAVINMPRFHDHVEAQKLRAAAAETADSPAKAEEAEAAIDDNCKTYVYAAYLCPGLHQFVIYCPKTKRAFCKDIVIDLNSCDGFLEYPEPLRPPKEQQPKKITRSNVWRKWREDSEEDVQMAFLADCSDSFEPELFIKDAEDVEACKRVLLANFEHIKIAYVEGLAGSPATYPEISFEYFIKSMLDQQHTEKEQKRLTRAHIELAFIRATRGDDAHGIQGTLCRGELLETLLRLCSIRHPKSVVSEYLDDFLFIYIKPQYDRSQIVPTRKEIRASKKLNQLLHDNKDGLFQLFTEHKIEPKGFTLESAKALLNPLSPIRGEPLIPTLREQFVYSKMTNLNDLKECDKYHYLTYVEFLELICRVARQFWEPIRQRNSEEAPPVDMEDTVFGLLEMMWARRQKVKPKVDAKKKKSKKKKKPFPELVPCLAEDEDED